MNSLKKTICTKVLASSFIISNLLGFSFGNSFVSAMKDKDNIARPVPIKANNYLIMDSESESIEEEEIYDNDDYIELEFEDGRGSKYSLVSIVDSITSFNKFKNYLYHIVGKYGFKVFDEEISAEFPLNIKVCLLLYNAYGAGDTFFSANKTEFIENLEKIVNDNRNDAIIKEMAQFVIDSIKED